MPTKFSDSRASQRQVVAQRITELVSAVFPERHPGLGVYLIGSVTHEGSWGIKDLDFLLINMISHDPLHIKELHSLLDSLRFGNPFDGTFDAAGLDIHESINDIIKEANSHSLGIEIDCSFGFGPVPGEINVADSTLHLHICGPLTPGDLEAMKVCLPFHAAEFSNHNRTLVGPGLAVHLGNIEPTPNDLVYWDELTLSRLRKSDSTDAKRKWFKRLLRNRRFVSAYARKYGELLLHCECISAEASVAEMESLLLELFATAKVLEQEA